MQTSNSYAVCAGTMLNPITGVNWECIFPIKIAGIPVGTSSGLPDTPDLASSPICVCPIAVPPFVRPGIPISLWEPSKIVETVKDPLCFPTLGMGLDSFLSAGTLGGAVNSDSTHAFAQAHEIIFPIWAIIGMLLDAICLEAGSEVTVAYLTEIDPLWQNPELSMFIHPEAVLFANPFSTMACMADAATSIIGLPLDPLFWCMGSWSNAYPMTGHIDMKSIVEANAGIASRLLYKLARQLMSWDCATDICGCLPLPIWVKSHYRMHISKPVKHFTCTPIGQEGLLWSWAKNLPVKGDNFLWMIFEKRACCAF